MSASTHSDGGPLPLWRVLQAEYVQVHGPLPAEYVQARDEALAELKPSEAETAAETADRKTMARHDNENGAVLPLLYRAIHELRERRTALCLSGGGIRSATFALGVLQGLSQSRLLCGFDFLSTVSGGGYIGSWLTAWAHRDPGGHRAVQVHLAESAQKPLEPQPPAVAHLREFSNYLSPRIGLLSADTWTLVATYVRNLTLNWLVILPALALVLMIPRVCYWAVAQSTRPGGNGTDLRTLGTLVLLVVGVALHVWALVASENRRPSYLRLRADGHSTQRETQGTVLWRVILPLCAAAVFLTMAWWQMHNRPIPPKSSAVVRTAPATAPETTRVSPAAGRPVTLPASRPAERDRSEKKTVYVRFIEYYVSSDSHWFTWPLGLDANGCIPDEPTASTTQPATGLAPEAATRTASRAKKRTATTAPDQDRPEKPGWVTFWNPIIAIQLLIGLLAWAFSMPRYVRRGRALGWHKSCAVVELVFGLVVSYLLGLAMYKVSTLDLLDHRRPYTIFAAAVYLLLVLLSGVLLRGLLSRWTSDEDREWTARLSGWLLIFIAVWVVAAEIVLFVPSHLLNLGPWLKATIISAGGLAGVATAWLGMSPRTPANDQKASEPGSTANPGGAGGMSAMLRQAAVYVAAPLFFLAVLVGLVLGTDWLLVRFAELPGTATTRPAATAPASRPADGPSLPDAERVADALAVQQRLADWLAELDRTLVRLTGPDAAVPPVTKTVLHWRRTGKAFAAALYDEKGDWPSAALVDAGGQPLRRWLEHLDDTCDRLLKVLRRPPTGPADPADADADETRAADIRQLLEALRLGHVEARVDKLDAGRDVPALADLVRVGPDGRPVLRGAQDWHAVIIETAGAAQLGFWSGVLVLVTLAASWAVNINAFSIHALYRDRLIRAYLGASRPDRDRGATYNRFTGFDPADNVPMSELAGDRDPKDPAAGGQPVAVEFYRWAMWLKGTTDEAEESKRPGGARFVHDELVKTALPSLGNWDPATQTLPPAFKDAVQGGLDAVMLDPGFTDAAFKEMKKPEEVPDLTALSSEGRAHYNARLLHQALPDLVARPGRLMPVLNMALNLATGSKLAWQQRMATSFTATPLHCGSLRLGYRPSSDYAWSGGPKATGLTLGTALAVSGAAANPNWGYHSSPSIAFLMTLLNVRLGVWLGNPGPAGDKTYNYRGPSWALEPLLSEAFAYSDDEHRYVSLSDGGHFDNLGLYEMVLRRCHLMVVSDAGQDPQFAFEDFGNAIRKVSIDLGVPITYEGTLDMKPRQADANHPSTDAAPVPYCAVATVHYSRVDKLGRDGTIIYIKPAFQGSEPIDIYNYAQQCHDFPHETTVDQFFTESQFESYRRLGEYIVELIYATGSDRGPGLLRFASGPRSHVGLPTIFDIVRSRVGRSDQRLLEITGTSFLPGCTVTLTFADGVAVTVSQEPDLRRDAAGDLRVTYKVRPSRLATVTVTNPSTTRQPRRNTVRAEDIREET